MNNSQQIAQNIHSPFWLIHNALGDAKELAAALRIIRKFCEHHQIQLSVFTDGRFSCKNRCNPHQEYILQSLNALVLTEYFIEVAQFLNGQGTLNAVELATALLSPVKENIISMISEKEVNRIDLYIRQHYALNMADFAKHNASKEIIQDIEFNWKLFLPMPIKSIKELGVLLGIDRNTIKILADSGENDLYKFAMPLSINQVMLVTISDVCGLLSLSALQATDEFFITGLDCNTIIDTSKKQQLLFASLFAFSKLKQKPSFLIVKNKNTWSCLAIIPDLARKNNYIIQAISFAKVAEENTIQTIGDNLIKFIKGKEPNVQLTEHPINNLVLNKEALQAQNIILAIIISTITKTFKEWTTKKTSINWFETLNKNISTIHFYDNQLKLEVFARTRIRELYAFLQEMNFDTIAEQRNNQQIKHLDSLDDMRSNAAKIIIQILSTYKPHSLYDFFGYDFSKRRERLLNELIDICKDSEIWEIYGTDLSELKRHHNSGKLYQDLQFGIFLDQVIEDSKLPQNVINAQIHPVLLKLANAGQIEYRRHKEKAIASQANLLAMNRRSQLLRKMFDLLSQHFNNKSFMLKLEECINTWIHCNHEILQGMLNLEEKSVLNKEMIQILLEWTSVLGIKNFRHKTILPNKISLGKLQKEDVGEFIGSLCYQKAFLQYQGESTNNLSMLVYNRYNELLEQLPKEALDIHAKYVENKRCKIQARRLLRIFEDYRTLYMRRSHSCKAVFDRALIMLHDPIFCESLKPTLQNIVKQNEFSGKTWADTPKNMLKNKDFGKFLYMVIKLAGVPKAKLRLSSKILKSLELRKQK